MRRAAGLVVVACLMAVLTPGATADAGRLAPTPGAAGIGDPYFPLDGNGGYDVSRYSVHDRYWFGSGRLAGWTRISLRPTQDLSRFDLDFLLHVTAVQVDGAAAAFHRPQAHELQIVPAHALRSGARVTVVVRYDDHPDRYSYAGESNWLADADEVVAMNEPHMAPWWFPADDHPLDKALVDLHITVPNGRRVIANGRPAGRDVGATTTTWHWRADEPMAPYLAFFAAGSFDVATGNADGRPWLVAVSDQLPPSGHADAMTLMRRTPEIVHWLEQELGPYPFDTTGGVVTSLQPGFALENQTRPTYPPVGPGDVDLIVHELTHQWFGDDVAVRHWADIWLNEGFATYLEVRYDETHGGQTADGWLRATYASRPSDSTLWDLAVAKPGRAHLFDEAVYLRGAMTLAALRNRIGDTDVATLLRTWAGDHHRGNGSDAQFRALAETVSGQDLDAFFTAWLDTRTKPADTVANGLG